MENRFLYKNYKIVILVIAITLFLVGAYFHTEANFFGYRLIRGLIPLMFLTLLYYFHRRKVYQPISLFLFFYGTSSIASVWYENDIIATLSMALNFLSYLVLIIALIPKVDLKKMKGIFLIGFILMVIINGYLIYSLVDMIKGMSLSDLHFAFINVSTMALLTLTFFALLYNHAYSTKGSLFFTLFVFLILFSEVFRALGYYKLAYGNIDVYIARILLILAMCTLVQYSMINKKNQELLNFK